MKQFVSILLIGFLTVTAVMGEKAFNAINLDARKSAEEGPELRAELGQTCSATDNCRPGLCCRDDGNGPKCVAKEGNECKNRCDSVLQETCNFHADGHPGVPGCCRVTDGQEIHCQKKRHATCDDQSQDCEGQCDCNSCTTLDNQDGACCGGECIPEGDVTCQTCPGCRQCQQCFPTATCRQKCFKLTDDLQAPPTGCCDGDTCGDCPVLPNICCPEGQECVDNNNPGRCENGNCVTTCATCTNIFNINTCSNNGGGSRNCGGNGGGGGGGGDE